jgi:molybdate transport system substrate-binding protein
MKVRLGSGCWIAVALVGWAGVLLPGGLSLHAEVLRVAVASNFRPAFEALQPLHAGESEVKLIPSYGSTGQLYAQIRHGAPYGVFLAADAERPRLLEEEGRAVAGSRFTYAVGRLALWSPREGLELTGGSYLVEGDFRYLALANPDLAPYGAAARALLQRRGLWEGLAGRIVRGQNIAQAFQLVDSGAAELGFVAYAQVLARGGGKEPAGSLWLPSAASYPAIEQQAVALEARPAAADFLRFLRSDRVTSRLREWGYRAGSGE